MSTALLALAQAAPLLGCRDPRTARRRLEELGVPVLVLSGRVLVDEGDIMRARRARARPLDPAAPVRWAGVHLAPGTRLWDVPHASKWGRAVRPADPVAPTER